MLVTAEVVVNEPFAVILADDVIDADPPALKQTQLHVLLLMAVLGLVGFTDDFLKTRKQQSLGLGGWAKVAGQILVATVFALLAIRFPNSDGKTPATTTVSLFPIRHDSRF